jgi:hypothetical protein
MLFFLIKNKEKIMKSINSKINLLIIMSALTGCWGGGRGGWDSSLATLTENQNLQPTTHELIDVVGSVDDANRYSDSISLDVMASDYSSYYEEIGQQNGYNTYRGLPTTLLFEKLPKNEDNVEGVSAYVKFIGVKYSTTEIIDTKNGTFSLILNDTTPGSNKAFNVLLGTDTIKEIGDGKNLADYALWQYGEIVDGKFVPDNDSYYEGAYATLRMPSGEMRYILLTCKATIGQVGNLEHEIIRIGKAGKTRHMGTRPTVRGVVMNPCDHPHGGGEGRAPIGRSGPVTPWGKPALGYKTRKKKSRTNKMILKRVN